MSDQKLKPCPCGKNHKLEQTEFVGRRGLRVMCAQYGCALFFKLFPVKAWQSLPRPSKTALEIAAEMEKACRLWGAGGGFKVGRADFKHWASRLKQSAEPEECNECSLVRAEIGAAHMDGHGGVTHSAVRELVEIADAHMDCVQSRAETPAEVWVMVETLPGAIGVGVEVFTSQDDAEKRKAHLVSVDPRGNILTIRPVPIHGATQETPLSEMEDTCIHCQRIIRLDAPMGHGKIGPYGCIICSDCVQRYGEPDCNECATQIEYEKLHERIADLKYEVERLKAIDS